ncbi:pentapeptide repeat-containing protein [Streptomyces chartreusis]|uniref:pentapeptide repeat-containing protein n=1 Tax=Streptomyces chartreusis TaxID=1969 RepID=UPI00367EAA31
MPIELVLVTTFLAAVLVGIVVFYTGWNLLGARTVQTKVRITSTTLFDLAKLSFGVVAGAGALVALIVAYRRQRIDEDGALREATRLHTERFTTAVTQLADDSAAVRLGGVHALAGLADDAPTRGLRQTCIDVLCAYLRLPHDAAQPLTADAHSRHEQAMREVRHTALRLIGDHLRLPAGKAHTWRGHDFDFTSVVFDAGDFSNAVFCGETTRFDKAVFSGGTVSFDGAVFSGSTTSFEEAVFSGGRVTFDGTEFSGKSTSFNKAAFSGASVEFLRAQFRDGEVNLSGEFSAGSVHFVLADFSGARVSFTGAEFSDSRVSFSEARFSGSTVTFGEAVPWGNHSMLISASFTGGSVSFDEAVFSRGGVLFGAAKFDGSRVDFNEAKFIGGTVDLSETTGQTPSGLPLQGTALPDGLALPAAGDQ